MNDGNDLDIKCLRDPCKSFKFILMMSVIRGAYNRTKCGGLLYACPKRRYFMLRIM